MSGHTQQALMAAYRKLPLLQGITDADLHRLANSLLLGSGIMAVNKLPRAINSQAERGAQKEIEKLAKLCLGLRKHIESMHSDALRALEKAECTPHPLLLVNRLKDVIRAAGEALNHGEFAEPKKGAPLKRYERSMADRLLRDYEHLTGKRGTVPAHDGTAYGQFLEFIKTVMPLLGIGKGFESQARAATRRRDAKEKNAA